MATMGTSDGKLRNETGWNSYERNEVENEMETA
jgi:hypothetical protein